MNEQEKYDLIKNLVAKNGNPRIASIKLDCSIRTIKRLITKNSKLREKVALFMEIEA